MALLDLPTELLVRIASHLTTSELGPLRQSAKTIENALFDTFSREFFTKRQFMVEHESLEALVGIANHPGLAPRLTEVLIGTDTLSYVNNPQLAVERFDRGHVSRQTLIQTGLARDMLAEAFSKLPNLRTVGLRDFEGQNRLRDGLNARWRSWGWTVSRRSEHAHPSSILPLIVSALGAAKVSPTNLEVILQRGGGNHLTNDAFELPTGRFGADIVSMLAHLETLMLAIQSHDLAMPAGGVAVGNFKAIDGPLQRFLHYTPNLKTLRLNFKIHELTVAQRVIEWLGAPTSSAPIDFKQWPMPSITLASLTTLDFGMATVSASALQGAIRKFRSLQSFSLHKVALRSENQDIWAVFLESLSTSLPPASRLRSVNIGNIYQSTSGSTYGDHSNVFFVPEGTDPAKKKEAALKMDRVVRFQAKYTAKSVHQWLEELSERTYVEALYRDSDSEPEDDIVSIDSEAEDEDEDEDE